MTVAVFITGCVWAYLESYRITFLYVKKCLRARVSKKALAHTVGYDYSEIVKAVSSRAGIVPPKLCFVKDLPGEANLYPLGRRSIILVSDSLAKKAPAEVFEGVIAHEAAHVKNGRGIFAADVFSCGFLWCAVWFLVVVLAVLPLEVRLATPILSAACAAIILFFCCRMLLSVLNKKEEFRADRVGLSLTRYPKDMVRFLWKSAAVTGTPHPLLRRVAYFIAGADTHPSMGDRAEALQRILDRRNCNR